MTEDDFSKRLERRVSEGTKNLIVRSLVGSPGKKSSWTENWLVVIGLIAIGFFIFAPSGDDDQPDAARSSATISEPVPRATLTITSKGMKERRIPHNPDSPFFDTHELELRTIRRTDGYDWLPAEEVHIGCAPCFHALTYVALMDGEAFAINGSTRHWAHQMQVAADGNSPRALIDPYAEGGPAAPTDSGNPQTVRFSRLIQEIQEVPGCRMLGGTKGSMQRLADAVTRGLCLPGE